MDGFIRFECPACQKKLKAPPEQVGKKARCACGHRMNIPLSKTAAPAARASRPAPPARPTPRAASWPWVAVGAALLTIAVGFGVWLLWGFLNPTRPAQPPAVVQAAPPTPPKVPPARPTQDPPSASTPMDPPHDHLAPPPTEPKKPDASSGAPLPGSAGPRLTYVGKLAAEMKITGIGMVAPLADLAPGETSPLTFPSGTQGLDLTIVFQGAPPDGTTLGRSIRSEAGPVTLKGFVFLTEENNATGEFVARLGCEPENGPFADGNYQTTVMLNDEAIAVLNWTVGKKSPR